MEPIVSHKKITLNFTKVNSLDLSSSWLYNIKMSDISIKIKAQAEAKFELSVARKTLEERVDQQLLVAYNGGLFKASTGLIAFLTTWPVDTLYLKDEYNRPVEIYRTVLLAKLSQEYSTVMNDWHTEYHELVKVRKVADV